MFYTFDETIKSSNLDKIPSADEFRKKRKNNLKITDLGQQNSSCGIKSGFAQQYEFCGCPENLPDDSDVG